MFNGGAPSSGEFKWAYGAVRGDKGGVLAKQNALLHFLAQGNDIKKACEKAGVSRGIYYHYRKINPDFADMVDIAAGKALRRDEQRREQKRQMVPDFPEFCEEYLGMRLFPHQLQWFDMLEGRPPRDLHPQQVFRPNDPDLLVVNCPPAFGKSSTITVAYSTWRIVRDPTTRIVIVSKAQRLAIQFLLTIKTYLTHPGYEKLQKEFGPPGGYAAGAASWKQDLIYVGANLRDTAEKDPTVQAIGIGGQLYGARADLVILDDVIDNLNAYDFEKQAHWVQSEVISRIPDGGKVLLVGTRLAAQDLYSEIRADERYGMDGDGSPWTLLTQPAVLEYAEKPEDWVTLWPYADKPTGRSQKKNSNGLYTRWDGPSLNRRRARMSPQAWERVYQQAQISAEATFQMKDLIAANGKYSAGLIQDSSLILGGHGTAGRKGGMRGLRVVGGLDPAAAGFTAAVVIGLDPATGIQWVLDCHNEAAMLPHTIKDLIKSWTAKYGIAEWVVEKNGFQGFLSQDVELRTWVAANGGVIREHWTGQTNKMDSEMGVAGMASLFENGLIKLPRTDQKPAVRQLVDQLAVWGPGLNKHVKTDLVMALWFASKRCSELVRLVTRQDMFDKSSDWFQTRWDVSSRHVIDSLEEEMMNMPMASMWGSN